MSSSAARYCRFLFYAFCLSFLVSRLTYVTTYARPDRPFTFDHVLGVMVLGFFASVSILVLEYGVASARTEAPLRPLYFMGAGFLLLLALFTYVESLMAVDETPCAAPPPSIVYIAHASTPLDAAVLQRNFPFVSRVFPMANLSFANSSHPDFERHYLSTFALLKDAYAREEGSKYIVVLEDGAKSLPNFRPKLESWICRHPMQELIWLQAPAILRWSVTGGIVDGTTAMVYKRASIPKFLDWLETHALQTALTYHDASSYEIVAYNHRASDACWTNAMQCGVVPLVVEELLKRYHLRL